MPIITDKKQLVSLKEEQKSCFKCEQNPGRNERSAIIVCDVCANWICKDCAEIDDKLYELVVQHNVSYTHICSSCKDEIPKIQDLIKINQKLVKIEENIMKMKEDIEANKTSMNEVDARLAIVETIIQQNKLDDEAFPRLPTINDATEKLQQALSSQQLTTNKLNTNLEEERRKASKTQNLIIYGLPETEETIKEQMRADFHSIRELYADRVELTPKDISGIARLGQKKEKQVRPVRITFVDLQKRREVLINNKGLTIEGFQYEFCKCKAGGQHIHINITNDKTKQERDQENKLREELKQRRTQGEDLIIKNGKIVKRTLNEAYPRWAEICQDGY